MLIENLISKTL